MIVHPCKATCACSGLQPQIPSTNKAEARRIVNEQKALAAAQEERMQREAAGNPISPIWPDRSALFAVATDAHHIMPDPLVLVRQTAAPREGMYKARHKLIGWSVIVSKRRHAVVADNMKLSLCGQSKPTTWRLK